MRSVYLVMLAAGAIIFGAGLGFQNIVTMISGIGVMVSAIGGMEILKL